MKIVVIGGWAPSLIRFRAPLLEAMVARGHEVHAWAPEGTPELRDELAGRGVRFEELSLERAGLDAIADVQTIWELVRRLRKLRPDIVFSYTIKPVIYGTIAARIAAVPRRAALVTGLGWAFTRSTHDLRRRMVRALATSLYRFALDACEVVFLQNPDDREDLVGHGALAPNARVEIIRGSGVDLAEYSAVELPQLPMRFLFMGRLLRDKGIYEYVDAARLTRQAYPEARFAVLGSMDSNPASVTPLEIETWVRSGTIEYLGSTSDVRPHLARTHVLVLPSYREGTPRSVLEAMSTSRVVITTDVPGCRATIVNGESGLLVPVRDPVAIARAAARLISDPELLQRLARAARVRAETLYDARKVAASILDALAI